MAVLTGLLSDALKIAGTDSFVLGRLLALTDELNLHDATTRGWRYRMQVQDRLGVSPLARPGAIATAILAAKILARDAAYTGLTALLRDRLRIRGALSTHQATVLREALRLVAGQSVEAHYAKTLRDAFALEASTGFGLGAFVSETLRLRPTIAEAYRALRLLADELHLGDVLTMKLMLVAIARDDIVVNGLDLIQSIYQGTLSDGIDFILDTVDPGGDVTTWALNVRTGAVTQYLNYSFNAFGQSPSGTYLGAADDGLYALTGPDDAGTPVIGDMISGLAELTGGFLTSMKAAYIATRGGGDFYLKLTAGTGESYTYRVKTSSLKTARIDIGKGLRARFFTFELVSTGQDFDLQGLTFIPVQSTRRV